MFLPVKFEEQELPIDNVSCPECGGEVTDESLIKHNLGNVGYLHDDISFECESCGHQWPHGVPIGNPPEEYYQDLICGVCEEFMRTHRFHPKPNGNLDIDLKCPNCFYFKTITRESDENNRVLMGWPMITGSFEDATGFGQPEGNRHEPLKPSKDNS